jgi:hypothetical protein
MPPAMAAPVMPEAYWRTAPSGNVRLIILSLHPLPQTARVGITGEVNVSVVFAPYPDQGSHDSSFHKQNLFLHDEEAQPMPTVHIATE